MHGKRERGENKCEIYNETNIYFVELELKIHTREHK